MIEPRPLTDVEQKQLEGLFLHPGMAVLRSVIEDLQRCEMKEGASYGLQEAISGRSVDSSCPSHQSFKRAAEFKKALTILADAAKLIRPSPEPVN